MSYSFLTTKSKQNNRNLQKNNKLNEQTNSLIIHQEEQQEQLEQFDEKNSYEEILKTIENLKIISETHLYDDENDEISNNFSNNISIHESETLTGYLILLLLNNI